MKKRIGTALAALAAITFGATWAAAHIIPWQPGESRQVGYGSCAKGPCMKRASWAASKPHRHVGSRVIIEHPPRGAKYH
jgi:hypothetical protein